MAPRTDLTRTTVVGPYPTLQPVAGSLDVTMTAADVANKNAFVMSNNDVLLVQNTDAVNPYTFTATSVSDDLKRSGDITTYSVAAGKIAAFKLNKKKGWMQSDGKFYVEGSNAALKFGVLVL